MHDIRIRITCPTCQRIYFVPIEWMEIKDIIEMACKTCDSELKIHDERRWTTHGYH
jgi:hypothetical protein